MYILFVLEYESHHAALNYTSTSISLLPPITKDDTGICTDGTVQAYSRSYINTSYLNIYKFKVCNCFNAVSLFCFSLGIHGNRPKILPQNMPQYRNVFNDHARRDFCYWLSEKKAPKCKFLSNLCCSKMSLWCDIHTYMWLEG